MVRHSLRVCHVHHRAYGIYERGVKKFVEKNGACRKGPRSTLHHSAALLNGVNKIKQRIYNDNIEGPWLGDVEEWRQVP
jgi:hypothetical protein